MYNRIEMVITQPTGYASRVPVYCIVLCTACMHVYKYYSLCVYVFVFAYISCTYMYMWMCWLRVSTLFFLSLTTVEYVSRRTFVLLPSVVHEHDHCIRSSAVEFRIFYIRGRSPSDRRRSARLRFSILLEQLVYFSSLYVTRVGQLRFEGVSKFSNGLRT